MLVSNIFNAATKSLRLSIPLDQEELSEFWMRTNRDYETFLTSWKTCASNRRPRFLWRTQFVHFLIFVLLTWARPLCSRPAVDRTGRERAAEIELFYLFITIFNFSIDSPLSVPSIRLALFFSQFFSLFSNFRFGSFAGPFEKANKGWCSVCLERRFVEKNVCPLCLNFMS